MDERQILDAARSAAARRQYRLALSLVDVVKGEALQPEVMMLRGKIHAQTGRYDEAIKAWKEVLAKTPDNQEAGDAIRRAEQMQKSPMAPYLSRIRAAAAAGAVLCLLLLMMGSFALGRRMTAGDHTRTQGLVREVQAQLNGISRDAVSEVLASQTELQRQNLLRVVEQLQCYVQSVLDRQTASVVDHLDGAAGDALAGLRETRDRLSALQQEVAKEQTTAAMAQATRDFQTDLIRQMQGALARLQEIQNQQAPILETYAADRQTMTSVRKSLESFQQGLSGAQGQIGQIMAAQVADGKTLASVSQSMESFQQELVAMRERIARERERSEHRWRMTVEILRPADMDQLERQIEKANETRAALEAKERELRDQNFLAKFLRHRDLQRKLKEAEGQCRVLQDRWNKEVVPWMEAWQACDPPASGTEQ
jgi:tetratricopeptide (TPR) repeat protein